MKIYATNISVMGPGKVYQNLLKGLRNLNVKFDLNTPVNPGEKVCCLQNLGQGTMLQFSKKSLVGPNIFVLPSEEEEICKHFENFLVPSKWVHDKYKTYDNLKNSQLHIWPVGIDTEEWKPSENQKELDCFVYYKNRDERELRAVASLLKKKGLRFKIIQYGSYSEPQLKELCEKSKFAVLLTGTESQGIAYMQILSSGLPCYVFEKRKWTYEKTGEIFPATSVPYFNKCCGVRVTTLEQKFLDEFVEKVDAFKPRKYILENHTLEKSAQKYLDIYNSIGE